MSSRDDANVEENAEKQRAIALRYDRELDPAPRIAASGEGEIAVQILKIAEEHGIPVREDASLAEILSVLEVDSFIPLEAYAAVAEILSYLYKQDAAKQKKSVT